MCQLSWNVIFVYKWDGFVEEGGGSMKGKEKGKGEKKKRKERK